jgi:hypothetical protein
VLFCLCVFTSGLFATGDLYVFGTFDLNNNGKSEILKLGGLYAQLEYIELGPDGRHHTLWTYSPDEGTVVIDAKFNDLNNDGIKEIVVIQKSSKNSEWLKVFEWNGQGFSSNFQSVENSTLENNKIRPANLTFSSNAHAVSMSTPSRRVALFSLQIKNGQLLQSDIRFGTGPLVKNGYGPVYSGLFSSGEDTFVALMSPEGNVLKTIVFSISNPTEILASDALAMHGAQVVLGSDIQPFDENKDGQEELLVPFATGEVYSLAFSDSGLSFTESKLSQSNLFGMKSAAGETEINNTLLSRVESGLHDSIFLQNPSPAISDSLLLLVTDTLLLGDTLNLFVLPDSASTFYSFSWRTTPPSGMLFNPKTYQIKWVPTRNHIGVVDVAYALNIRVSEALKSEQDELGDAHYIYPILEARDSSMIILIGDTIKPPEPLVLIPPRFHRVSVTTKDINESDRFLFEGETPFGASSINNNSVITIGVSANLSTIKQNKSAAFNFKSSGDRPDSISTLSLVHDLNTNILYMSVFPPRDTITQSFDPEGFNNNFYNYPEYFFEGFPSNLSMDSTTTGALTFLSCDTAFSGNISLSSPLYNQDHDIAIFYFGGRPYSIRGDISVKKDGSQKTITEIDFDSSITPLQISAWLTPATRDTFIFHSDSIPDTLKTKTGFQSFYSPATKLKYKTPPVEKLEDVGPTKEPQSTQTNTAKLEILSADSTLVVPEDSLSFLPKEPSPISIDTMKAPEPVATPDST